MKHGISENDLPTECLPVKYEFLTEMIAHTPVTITPRLQNLYKVYGKCYNFMPRMLNTCLIIENYIRLALISKFSCMDN